MTETTFPNKLVRLSLSTRVSHLECRSSNYVAMKSTTNSEIAPGASTYKVEEPPRC
jgi:hypothetical protein